MTNKRGTSEFKAVFLSAIVILALFVIFFSIKSPSGWEWAVGLSEFLSTYVFGLSSDAVTTAGFASTTATLMTFMMVWLIIFVSFGDIIAGFSSFSDTISWILAFAMAVVFANIGVGVWFFTWLTAVFVWAGAIAVYIGLGASFVVFLLANLGLTSFAGWIRRRKELIKAATGADKVRGSIRGLKKIEEELQKE